MAKVNDNLEVEMVDTFDLLTKMGDSDQHGQQTQNRATSQEMDDDDDDDDDTSVSAKNPTTNIKSQITGTVENENDNDSDPLVILQKQWIADGRLPKDHKITDKEEDLDKAFYEHKVKSMVDEKIDEFKKSNGLSDIDINKSKGVSLGIDPQMYDRQQGYKALSSIEFDEDSENYEKDIREYLNIYYKDLKMPASKIERTIDADIESEEINDTLKEARAHFLSQEKGVSATIKSEEARVEKEKADKINDAIAREKGYITAGKVAGTEFTKAEAEYLMKGFYDKTETITTKDGRAIKVTLYNKKIHEITNDPEKAFLTKAKFLLDDLGDDLPQEKAGKMILSQLRNTTKQKNRSSAAVEMLG